MGTGISILIGVGVIMVALLLALAVIAGYEKHEQRVMSPEEEARYEIHPTLYPAPVALTAGNVQDVIHDSIETGVEHPLLTARKQGLL